MAYDKEPDVLGDLPKDELDACLVGDMYYTGSSLSPAELERAKLAGFRGLARRGCKPEELPGFTVAERAEYRAFLRQWKAD
jgi:hypothetical protein